MSVDLNRKSIIDLAPITSPYGDTSGRSVAHNGIDIGVPMGTPLATQVGGQVERTLYDRIGGTQVIVKTPQGFEEVFAHLSNIAVSVGDVLQPGQNIGYSGASGDVTGPHVHYEIRNPSGGTMDPIAFLSEFVPGFASAHPSQGGSSTSGGLTALPASAPASSSSPASSTLSTGATDPIKCAMILTFSALPRPALAALTGIPESGLQAYAYACASAVGQKSGIEAFVAGIGGFIFDPKSWAKIAFTGVGVALIITGVLFYTKALTPQAVIAAAAKAEA